jgi:hypothetical protein
MSRLHFIVRHLQDALGRGVDLNNRLPMVVSAGESVEDKKME